MQRGVTVLKFPLYLKTRWLSRYECLKVLTGNLAVLMEFLDRYNTKKTDPMEWAQGVQFRKRLSSLKNISYLFLVLDLIDPLHELSLKLQMDSAMPHEVHMHVNSCVARLKNMFVDPASFKQSSLNHFNGTFRTRVTPDGKMWKPADGISFPLKNCNLNALRREFCNIAEFVMATLNERFSSSELLSNFVIFVPKTYHRMEAGDVESFGWDMLKGLLKHFCSSEYGDRRLFFVSGSELQIMREFNIMKERLYETVNGLDQFHTFAIWKGCMRQVLLYSQIS
jgi:hypothetical protein